MAKSPRLGHLFLSDALDLCHFDRREKAAIRLRYPAAKVRDRVDNNQILPSDETKMGWGE
jgi:hypothetical protein